MKKKYGEAHASNEHLQNLLARLQSELHFFQRSLDETAPAPDNTLTSYQQIYLDLLDRQRALLKEMNHHEEFDEELIRKYLSLIDIEEYKVREKLAQLVVST